MTNSQVAVAQNDTHKFAGFNYYYGVMWSPDSQKFALVGGEGGFIVLQAQDLAILRDVQKQSRAVICLGWGPDSQTFAWREHVYDYNNSGGHREQYIRISKLFYDGYITSFTYVDY